MGYTSEAVQKEFGLITKNERKGEFFRVARVIPANKNSLQSIDVREMYTPDKATPSTDERGIAPSSKGLRIHSELIVEVMLAMYKALSTEEVMELEDAIEQLKDTEDSKQVTD